MKSYIEYIRDNYQYIRENQNEELFRGYRNSVSTIVRDIENSDLLQKFDNINIEFSIGIGNLPLVPWLVFLNNDITDSPRRGYYVVYLFSEDFKRLYLSLNQGWIQYRDDQRYNSRREKIAAARAKAESYRNLLEVTDDYSLEIDLGVRTLARGYEACNIYAIEYDLSNLPNEEKLSFDLELLLEHYFTLASLLNNIEVAQVPVTLDANEAAENFEPIQVDPPLLEEFAPQKRKTAGGSSVDFEAIHKVNKRHGDLGEKIVLEFEKKRAVRNNLDHSKVVLVSNDVKLGYDIVSLNDAGEEIFIEVKSTNKKGNQAFNISINEIEKFEEFADKYFIYRVSHLFSTPQIFVIDYNYFASMYKKPSQYIAYFKTEKLD